MTDDFVLAVDAATYAGSVAVLCGTRVVEEAQVVMRGATEERLMPAIVEALARAGVGVNQLVGVACGAGPGSFTSLRIAAALAKGIAFSRGIPLLAASSLTLILAADESLGAGEYLAQLDAMRGELYVQRLRKHSNGRIEEVAAPMLLSMASAAEMAASEALITIGNAGAAVERPSHARGFAALLDSIAAPVSVSTWEPLYGRLAEAQVQWELRAGRALAQP